MKNSETLQEQFKQNGYVNEHFRYCFYLVYYKYIFGDNRIKDNFFF